MTLTLEHFYILVGLLLGAVAVMNLLDRSNPRRVTTALFWGLYALLYLAGERLPPAAVGALMILMALVAGFGWVHGGKPSMPDEEARRASAARLGNLLFLPALLLPIVTVIGATLLKDVQLGGLPMLDQKHLTLVSLGCGAIIALAAANWLTRSTPLQGVREARRLVDAISWAVVLPHMLAVLGLLFTEAGVGKAVAHVTTSYINMDSRLVAVAVFCLGMALFTVVMGNGFAAFPVMAGGVGIPVLVNMYGANPAVMAAIGMFSAYCGTLMTPMAANFNIVPAVLLDLPDKNAVIRAQIPTALPLLGANIVLLYFLMNQ
ncbi:MULTISPECIES: DUF979 domain-containing protein [unclassified Massilia]|uniref:DUF979 domain-containing protein n=1 Tax=unclassified Massilia TaxID=2609279 RepID=UPI001B8251B6|nr:MULTISPECIES: DUF979 domain-containing protein [unclassified Massilia]MBQ5942638.1 DUF979 domain-containing protein [Massilia sp. AB1]MBQ5965450.1 DUF979 domain-containing protein [Massilia sp. ZL223]